MQETTSTNATPSPSSSKGSASLSQDLHETELGEFLLKNRVAVLSVLAVVLLGLVGFGIYTYWHGQKIEQWSELNYKFRSESLKDFTDKKIAAEDFKKSFDNMAREMKDEKILLLPLIESCDLLIKNGQKEMAFELLNNWGMGALKKDPVGEFLVGSRRAALLEDLGKNDEAISQLEKLLSSSQKIMETKTVLDLGRLYLKKGDADKALAQFQFVIDNTAQADLVKLARLYKGQISKK